VRGDATDKKIALGGRRLSSFRAYLPRLAAAPHAELIWEQA
jgi:hypothetical protein